MTKKWPKFEISKAESDSVGQIESENILLISIT